MNQEQAIEPFCEKRLLVLMPTGGGKSLCYQIPALMLDGLTVVFRRSSR
jgi:ATP-dependent DNA helicase RecQ